MNNNNKVLEHDKFIVEKPESWTVLAVDDDSDNLEVATTVLQFGGATVHRARNGVEGLKILETMTPSFILLDLSMPQMDGWEMFKGIRANPQTKSVPVIAVTAHAMLEDKERVTEAGFDGYITKPFRVATFLNEIQRCLRDLIPTV